MAIQGKVDELLHVNVTTPMNSYSKRRRMRKSKLVKQREEKDAARAFKLGRGRGIQKH